MHESRARGKNSTLLRAIVAACFVFQAANLIIVQEIFQVDGRQSLLARGDAHRPSFAGHIRLLLLVAARAAVVLHEAGLARALLRARRLHLAAVGAQQAVARRSAADHLHLQAVAGHALPAVRVVVVEAEQGQAAAATAAQVPRTSLVVHLGRVRRLFDADVRGERSFGHLILQVEDLAAALVVVMLIVFLGVCKFEPRLALALGARRVGGEQRGPRGIGGIRNFREHRAAPESDQEQRFDEHHDYVIGVLA